jgi:glycosyltransferase involved in cell wall biosynthesis
VFGFARRQAGRKGQSADDPATIPIFVISFNRGDYLRRVIDSYRRLATPTVIVVHDNGSDDRATLHALDQLDRSGITVVRRGKIGHADQLNEVDRTVRRYFDASRPPSPYVVTDCDVDLSIADPDALAVYRELLDLKPEAACVGPMLRIRDIPKTYPLYNQAMNRHIEQFWRHAPEWVETSKGRIACLTAKIDTTFALHRAGAPFRRLKPGIRVYEPYEALHLDWYEAAAQDPYRRSSSPAISHWNNDQQLQDHAGAALAYDRFTYVEREDGVLRVKTGRV